jgi:putative transposase
MYPSDLNDKEWTVIKDFFKPKSPRGRKPKHEKRALLNAVLYVTKGGIQWRMMPKDLPPWKTVYTFFRRMCLQGIWEKILDHANRLHRQKVGKNAGPTLAIVDSQSVKTQYDSQNKGVDGGKKN